MCTEIFWKVYVSEQGVLLKIMKENIVNYAFFIKICMVFYKKSKYTALLNTWNNCQNTAEYADWWPLLEGGFIKLFCFLICDYDIDFIFLYSSCVFHTGRPILVRGLFKWIYIFFLNLSMRRTQFVVTHTVVFYNRNPCKD